MAPSPATSIACSGSTLPPELDQATTEAVTKAARETTGATHCLAVLIALDDGPDRMDFGGTINIGIATADRIAFRRSRILGGREWVRLGAVELASIACADSCKVCRSSSAATSKRRKPRLPGTSNENLDYAGPVHRSAREHAPIPDAKYSLCRGRVGTPEFVIASSARAGGGRPALDETVIARSARDVAISWYFPVRSDSDAAI